MEIGEQERIIDKYRSENKHTIYYIKPNSSVIYFLDFKKKRFCPEDITFAENRTVKAARRSQVCFQE